ncbi:hypothetical protein D9M69_710250 [compost metagenome]
MRVDLADQEHLIAQAGDGFADDQLGTTLAVHFRRVDQPQPQFDALTQRGDFLAALAGILPHAPGTLANHRHLHTR